jgi:hypothetical protein
MRLRTLNRVAFGTQYRALNSPADKEIKEQLRETAVGSIHLDVWGVLFVMLGIIAGTASPEIAALVRAAWCR